MSSFIASKKATAGPAKPSSPAPAKKPTKAAPKSKSTAGKLASKNSAPRIVSRQQLIAHTKLGNESKCSLPGSGNCVSHQALMEHRAPSVAALLKRSIVEGDAGKVAALLQQDAAAVNHFDQSGMQPLHVSARRILMHV